MFSAVGAARRITASSFQKNNGKLQHSPNIQTLRCALEVDALMMSFRSAVDANVATGQEVGLKCYFSTTACCVKNRRPNVPPLPVGASASLTL